MQDLQTRARQTELFLELTRLVSLQHQRAQAELTRRGLEVTPARARALMALFQAREPLTAQQLSCRLGCTEASLVRVVRGLREGGWIGREPHPEDGRMWLLQPTDQARARLPDFATVSNDLFDSVFASMDESATEALLQTIRGMRTALEQG
jgi:DNA-binding MarR family transcriptional regulator